MLLEDFLRLLPILSTEMINQVELHFRIDLDDLEEEINSHSF